MVKFKKSIMLYILFLSITLIISGCDEQLQKDSGFLKGVISIGSICPVEKDPPDPACLPTYETYKAYPVTIWTSDGRRIIAQLNPALDGSYNLELNPGKYSVILGTSQNSIGSSNLPAEVEIRLQTETILNIDIDSGIR
jgi:small nuclear ribonucleoprotein (snRNP)-like protein